MDWKIALLALAFMAVYMYEKVRFLLRATGWEAIALALLLLSLAALVAGVRALL